MIVVAADVHLTISLRKSGRCFRACGSALAEPQTVPAGIYAKSISKNIGLWTSSSTKVVPTDNVRAALAAVESGNVDAGIVYKTDAGISKKVKVAYEVPQAESPRITYPLAVARGLRATTRRASFLGYLAPARPPQFSERYGFLILEMTCPER